MRLAAISAMLFGAALPAYALEIPVAAGGDPHVLTAAYSPYNRVRLVAVMKHSLTLTYAPGERIAHVILGDETLIEGPSPEKLSNAPLKNNLFLWPLKVGQTNMQVITATGDGGERLYQYDIAVHDNRPDGMEDPQATYGLIYTYPRDAHEAAAQRWKEQKAAQEESTAASRLSVDFFYGERNWWYAAQGKDKWMAPAEVSDNGRLTAFRWPGNTQIPAIYVVARDKTEQLQTPHMRDDLQIVQTVACHFRLRLGGGVLEVWNVGLLKATNGLCNAPGENPGTGTTSPDVVRELKSAQK